MHRPRYETNKDLQNEKEVSKFLEGYGIQCFKLPISYRLDWIAFRDRKLMGFIELKTRTTKRLTYPTLILSLSKFSAGCSLSRLTGTDFWVAAKWTDSLGFCCCSDLGAEIEMGGRHDRNDRDDFEPVVHLPVELFKDKPCH